MSLAAILILAFSAIFWVFISYLTSGNSEVSEKVDTRSSGIGTGWICVIILVIMAMMFLSNNAEDIQRRVQDGVNEQADAIWIVLLILFFLFMLYLKGAF